MKLLRVHALSTFITMLIALYAIFIFAPTERTMGFIGEVQRIFYFHVSSNWTTFLATFCVFLCSILFLLKESREWDIRAAAAAELGVVFGTLGLISGTLWARPVWGIWWTWDARLTSFFLLWLILLAYQMLRRVVDSPAQRGRLSAVFGILAAVDTPIVYMANRWWRTQHPAPVIAGGPGSGLDPRMALTLCITLGAFTLLYVYLWRIRCELERTADVIETLQRQLQTQGMEVR
ncbi:MAG TPA: cytochrome c biogenesis protein CcsA [Nitrososphaera sp.]|nr:cytochrome c biogenesis protein CcsA [Nitrososphaera sp.]